MAAIWGGDPRRSGQRSCVSWIIEYFQAGTQFKRPQKSAPPLVFSSTDTNHKPRDKPCMQVIPSFFTPCFEFYSYLRGLMKNQLKNTFLLDPPRKPRKGKWEKRKAFPVRGCHQHKKKEGTVPGRYFVLIARDE